MSLPSGRDRPAGIKLSTRNDCVRSAIPAPLTFVMHLAQTIFQSPPLLTIRRRVGQTLADLVFLVSHVLAMLPSPRLPALRADSGYPGYWDLYVGLPRKRSLSIDCLRERAREQHHSKSGKSELHVHHYAN
jgi:hypothetical protein